MPAFEARVEIILATVRVDADTDLEAQHVIEDTVYDWLDDLTAPLQSCGIRVDVHDVREAGE